VAPREHPPRSSVAPARVNEAADRLWWRDGVLYQIYPRSFADANGDGIGDLRGVIERLEHLEWLGVDGVWLNPITRSPNADWGYDVSGYTEVDPDVGTMHDLEELVNEAGRRGMRILLDLVPNHTSDRHPWFVESRSSRTSSRRDWYVWAEPRADGSPPNNWLSVFGGPAWTFDDRTGHWYLHNFLPEQPDLNWWNDAVRDAFDEVLRFWYDRGVAGFRIDVAHGIVKDQALRDNLPATDEDHPLIQQIGQRQTYNMNRPEVHEVLRRWRAVSDAYDPPRILVGETWALDLAELPAYYGIHQDELHLAFNFPFATAPFEAEVLRHVVEETEKRLAFRGWPVWTASNHDIGRMATRWCDGDERKVRVALLVLLTLRGTPFLYAGDEIGLPDAQVPREQLRDPVGILHWPQNPGRDGSRTPMPWTSDTGGGFTAPAVDPWLPVAPSPAGSVREQREGAGSILRLTRDLIALRRASPELTRGDYATIATPPGTWAYRRGRDIIVAVGMSDRAIELPCRTGSVVAATEAERVGSAVEGAFRIDGWEGIVVRSGDTGGHTVHRPAPG
jgi:alpha-glucosidase